jgi:hypothetical protein
MFVDSKMSILRIVRGLFNLGVRKEVAVLIFKVRAVLRYCSYLADKRGTLLRSVDILQPCYSTGHPRRIEWWISSLQKPLNSRVSVFCLLVHLHSFSFLWHCNLHQVPISHTVTHISGKTAVNEWSTRHTYTTQQTQETTIHAHSGIRACDTSY